MSKDARQPLKSSSNLKKIDALKLGPAKKQMDTSELVRWKQMVEKSKQDMKKKDMQIRKMEETMKNKDMQIRKMEETMKDKDLENKNLQDKVKELESQLLSERKLAHQHVDTKIAERQQQQQQQQ